MYLFFKQFGLLLTCQLMPIAPAIAPMPRPAKGTVLDFKPAEYFGEVLAADGKSITVRGKSSELANEEVITRTFAACPELIAGKQHALHYSRRDYRLNDVKVGDKVWLRIVQELDKDLCVRISIRRRPGGLVPPSPFEVPGTDNPHHVEMNAWQAFEEKGVPLSPKCDPVQQRLRTEELDRERKEFLKRLKWKDDHAAPPPRPAARK